MLSPPPSGADFGAPLVDQLEAQVGLDVPEGQSGGLRSRAAGAASAIR